MPHKKMCSLDASAPVTEASPSVGRKQLQAMHRRAQQAEARAVGLEKRIERQRHALEMRERFDRKQFQRLRESFAEHRLAFVTLARVFDYPQGATCLHSVMDGPPGSSTPVPGVWANCFLAGGGFQSFRVAHEVERAVAELECLRKERAMA
jgi:hypothetical protein